jgi:hypothetical protein
MHTYPVHPTLTQWSYCIFEALNITSFNITFSCNDGTYCYLKCEFIISTGKDKSKSVNDCLVLSLSESVLRIRDPGWSNGRLRIRDKQKKFVNCLYTKIGRIRVQVLFYPPDPGSGSEMEQWLDPDPGSNIPDPQHWSEF